MSVFSAILAGGTAHAASVGNQLGPGILGSGDWIQSPNGAYRFVMQGDGNLVLYGPGGPLWASYTTSNGAYLANQDDGNLVVYATDRRVVWASRSRGRGTLTMQDDGNVVAYGSGGPFWTTYTSGGANQMRTSGAVAFARNQIGKPYQYGAAGPNSYDCSGLTQKAYASVGVGLARSSYDQWNQGAVVSRGALQPGDLVFYNGRSHVALYVGNDEVIQALKTGTSVGYFPIGYAGSIDGYRHVG